MPEIPSQLIFVVIAIIVAVLKWLGDRAEEAAAKKAAKPPEPGQRHDVDGLGRSQEETPARGEDPDDRMRRFMEALGLPEDAAPSRPAPPPRPQPAPPIQRPVAKRRPVLTSSGPQQTARPRPSFGPPPLPPEQKPAEWENPWKTGPAAPPPPPREAPVIGAPKPVTAAIIPEIPPGTAAVIAPIKAPAAWGRRIVAPRQDSGPDSHDLTALRAELLSPRALQKAVLLREILGPPRSLQPLGSVSTFP